MDNERESLIKQFNSLKRKHDNAFSFRKTDSYKTTFQTVSILLLVGIFVLLAWMAGRKSKKDSTCRC